MGAYILIVFLVSGSQNLVWEITGQFSSAQCQTLLTQRVAAAQAQRPGSVFVGQCLQVAQ